MSGEKEMLVRFLNNKNFDYNPYRYNRISQDIIDFYNIKTTKKVEIFSGLSTLLDYVDWDKSLLDKNGKLKFNHREQVYHLLSCMYTRESEDERQYKSNTEMKEGYVRIHSSLLKYVSRQYKSLIKGLKKGTRKGAIIEIDEAYSDGSYSTGYRIAKKYSYRRTITYTYKKERRNLKNINIFKKLDDVKNEYIVRNLLETHSKIILPSPETVATIGKVYIVGTYNKGKLYVSEAEYCKKHKIKREDFREYIKNKKISSVDRDIQWYRQMYNRGLTIPTISKEFYRVSDLLTLLPRWIRELVKFKVEDEDKENEDISEIDVTALHPNILTTLYIDQCPPSEQEILKKYMTGDVHTKIAKYFNVDRNVIKKEFLSYFNMKESKMKFLSVHKFFEKNLPTFLSIIIDTKKSELKHKGTCKILFKNETIVLENMMKELHKNKIDCFQCYDAVFVPKSKTLLAEKLLNDLLKDLNLDTFVKTK